MNMQLQVSLLDTLWVNTYRATVTTINKAYVATVRLIVNVPKDTTEIPEGAPTVPAQLFVLVEDATLDSKDIIAFETTMSTILDEKFKKSISHIFFFYPSPQDMLQ